jgi:CspA family cold shock protein
MATGVVKWFNPTKGYGFKGGGEDVFVHISAVERAGLSTLNEGQQVQYEEVANKGKTSAERPQGEVNRMWGAPRGPPWGWIVSSPEEKPGDLDAPFSATRAAFGDLRCS